MKELWTDCEGGGVGKGELLIRSDPNYVGEIEPYIGRGRVRPLLQAPKMLSDSRMLQL